MPAAPRGPQDGLASSGQVSHPITPPGSCESRTPVHTDVRRQDTQRPNLPTWPYNPSEGIFAPATTESESLDPTAKSYATISALRGSIFGRKRKYHHRGMAVLEGDTCGIPRRCSPSTQIPLAPIHLSLIHFIMSLTPLRGGAPTASIACHKRVEVLGVGMSRCIRAFPQSRTRVTAAVHRGCSPR